MGGLWAGRACATASIVIIAALGAGVVAGCGRGGSDGSPVPGLLDRARREAAAAGTVQITGYVADRGYRTTMELRLVHGRGGMGVVRHGDRSYELLRIGSDLYVKGIGDAFDDLGAPAERLLDGRYLHVRADDANYADFVAYTQWETFFDQLLRPPGSADASRTVTSKRSTGVIDEAGRRIIWISRGRDSRPVRVTALDPGGTADVVEFTGYGTDVDLHPPAAARVVELAELEAALRTGAPAAD